MATEPSHRTIILHLLRGAVPERADYLSKLWVEHGHDVEVVPSTKGATMNSTSRRIRFDTKTVDLFWLMGFTVWRAIEVYGPAVTLAQCRHQSIDKILNDDEELPQLEFEYKQRTSSVEALISASSTDEITWPSDVPVPTHDRESLANDQEKLAFDLVCLAFAYALLHELRHVMFRKAGEAPTEGYEEEIACDTWARMIMTKNIADYAEANGHTFVQVEQKRATGIALAAAVVHAMTTPTVRWGNDEYPPIAVRLATMMAGHNPPNNSDFWLYTACLLVALFRHEHRSLDVSPTSYQELVETLIDRLN